MNVIQNVHFVFDLMHSSINSFFTKVILANIKSFQQHPVSEPGTPRFFLHLRQNQIKKPSEYSDGLITQANIRQRLRTKRSTKSKKAPKNRCFFLFWLAEWTGLEPATPGVTGRYSNQLNYHSAWCDFRSLRNQVPQNLATLRGFEPRYSP